MIVPSKLLPTTCARRKPVASLLRNFLKKMLLVYCCCFFYFCFHPPHLYWWKGKQAAIYAYLPCFDANLHFSILDIGHGFSGHPEFVQTPESRQQHRSHFFGISGRCQVFSFFSGVSVDHVLGFLRHMCSFFSHVSDLLLRLSSSSSSSGLWLMCSLRTDSLSTRIQPDLRRAYSVLLQRRPQSVFLFKSWRRGSM